MGRGKGKKSRNAHQKAHDQKQESTLRLEGKSYRAIAQELGISYETVRKDLAIIDRQITDEAKDDLELLKRQIAAKFRFAQVESAVAWRLSQEPAEQLVEKMTADGLETSRTLKGQAGAPSHMTNFIAATREEARLFDLYKPEKGGAVELNELEQDLAEQLKAARQEYGPS